MTEPSISRYFVALLCALCLTACAPSAMRPDGASGSVATSVEGGGNPRATQMMVDEMRALARMTPPELGKKRQRLAAAGGAETPLRLAFLLGLSRTPGELARAANLLDEFIRSTDPAALALRPLARLLNQQYQERLKLEAQNEKLSHQLRESQRRADELQEKLDALADIERSMPVRPNAGKILPGKAR